MKTKRLGKLEFYKDKRGKFRWKLFASNGEIADASTQGFSKRSICENNFDKVQKWMEIGNHSLIISW